MSFLKHSFEFLLVIIILAVAVSLLGIFNDSVVRFWIICVLAFFYVIFGIWHHWEERNLNLNQILEHAAIGLLIFVVLYSLYR